MAEIYHLIYTSDAVRELSNGELHELVEGARENNQITGITGLLLYQDGGFIQILEGEKVEVEGIFDLIRSDPRHTNIRVVYRGFHPTREFNKWSMGFRLEDESAFDRAMGICDSLQFIEPEGDVSGALRQLARMPR
ncbi:MAG: BLUF domain-containing protein [Xanthomonadales bacterium]|nr:BLUF domain-containing protein [Xanthomonadales bacterium]